MRQVRDLGRGKRGSMTFGVDDLQRLSRRCASEEQETAHHAKELTASLPHSALPKLPRNSRRPPKVDGSALTAKDARSKPLPPEGNWLPISAPTAEAAAPHKYITTNDLRERMRGGFVAARLLTIECV